MKKKFGHFLHLHGSDSQIFILWLYNILKKHNIFLKRYFRYSYKNMLSLESCDVIKKCLPETHSKRQATQHDGLPSLLDEGDTGIVIVYDEEKIFCTGLTRAAKAEQKFLVPALSSPTNQPRKKPFHLYSLSPLSPLFQQSEGATLF
jgi:hypothetical protein